MRGILLIAFLSFPFLLCMEASSHQGEIPCEVSFYELGLGERQEKSDFPLSFESDCELSRLELEVFDAWGKHIYSVNELAIPELHKEYHLPDGTYYYVAKYKFKEGGALHKKGGMLVIGTKD